MTHTFAEGLEPFLDNLRPTGVNQIDKLTERTAPSSARPLALISGLLAVLLTACVGVPGSSPAATAPATVPATPSQGQPTPGATAPPSTPAPSPIGTGDVGSSAQAAALVFASDPRWSQMMPLRADFVGQSSWYEASEDSNGFNVIITVGQGDCQAGCIERHAWQYHVSYSGEVLLVGETGDDVAVAPPAAVEGDLRVTIHLLAGPVCPVEQIPPAPNCAPRPVVGAEVGIYEPHGNQVATATSDDEGKVVFDVPAGAYYVAASPAEGIMLDPAPQAFAGLGGDQVGLVLSYDTGIR